MGRICVYEFFSSFSCLESILQNVSHMFINTLYIYIFFFFLIAPLTVSRKLCALLKSISINSRKAIMFHARISLRRSVLLFDPPFDHLPRDYYLVQCARSLLPINSRQQGEQRSPFELASRLRVIRSVTVSSFRVSNPARLEPTTLPVL